MTADGERFVAAGRDADGLAAWTSTDGVAWERHAVPDPGPTFTLEDCGANSMGPLAHLGGTLYSFGTFFGCGDGGRPLGWRSSDGMNWEFIESDNPFFGSGRMVHLAASDAALVAVTDNGLHDPYQSAWRWTSETSWTQTELISTTGRLVAVHDLTWSEGSFFVVGATYEAPDASQEEWLPQPAGWVSTDGRAWEPMALPESMLAACAVAPTTDVGFLVLGLAPDGPAAWTSADGASWTDAALMGGISADACASDVTVVEGGFVAAANTPGDLIILTSPDGATWAHIELGDVMTGSHRTAAFGDLVIVFTSRLQADGVARTVLFRGVVGP